MPKGWRRLLDFIEGRDHWWGLSLPSQEEEGEAAVPPPSTPEEDAPLSPSSSPDDTAEGADRFALLPSWPLGFKNFFSSFALPYGR